MQLLLAVYVSLIPVIAGLLSGGSAHDLSRITQVVILTVAVGRLFWVQRDARVVPMPCAVLLFAAGLLLLASIFAADHPWVALREVLLWTSTAALVLSMSRGGLKPHLLEGLIAGQAFYAALVMMVLLGGLVFAHAIDYLRLALGFDNIRFLNHAQTVSTPLLLGMLGHAALQHRRWRCLIALPVVFSLFMASLLQARATTAAFVGIGIAAPLLFGRTGLVLAKRLGAAALVGIALHALVLRGLPWLMDAELPRIYRPYNEASSIDARIYLLKTAWSDVLRHPLLGIGPMHYAHFFNGEAAHPHNIYAQVAAEYGLPLSLLVFVGVGWAMWRAARTIRERLPDDMLAVGSYLACLAALIDGCFSGNFVMPVSQMWIVLAVGLLMSRLRSEEPIVRASPAAWTLPRWLGRLGLGLLMLGQIWLTCVSWQEWRMDTPVIGSPSLPAQPEHLSPRFWRDGWF